MDAVTLGLIIHVAFLAIGVYLYLFARGIIRFGKPEVRARADEFRKDNGTWMRFLGLALAAIMGFNVFLDVQAMMAG
jgi:hypothetical protein